MIGGTVAELETVWHGALWREVPADVALPPADLSIERSRTPIVARVRALMADGVERRPAEVRTAVGCYWNAAQEALAQLEAEGVLRGWKLGTQRWYQAADANSERTPEAREARIVAFLADGQEQTARAVSQATRIGVRTLNTMLADMRARGLVASREGRYCRWWQRAEKACGR